MGYCARANVYAIGLGPEVFARPSRLIEGVTPGLGVLALRSHGFAADTPVTLAVLSSSTLGAADAALPTGLALGTAYFAQPVASDLFALSVAAGIAPIATFADEGEGVFGVLVDHGVYLDQCIDAATFVIDEHARAHKAPISANALPFVCAFLAARIYVTAHAAGNPEYAKAIEAPSWIRSIVDRLFALWISGAPVQGAADATPTIAENGAKLLPTGQGPFQAPRGGCRNTATDRYRV